MNSARLLFIALILQSVNIFGGIFPPVEDTISFIGGEFLSKPTTNSVSINLCTNKSVDFYIQYGLDSTNYTNQTIVYTTVDSIPYSITINNLAANSQYYYRLMYRRSGTTNYTARYSHFFHTYRPKGNNYTVAIQADPHMDTNSNAAVYTQTLKNILSAKPDFLFDLGDTFMSEKLTDHSQYQIEQRHILLRKYFDLACHSIPLFLVQGNHDGELGWLKNGTDTCTPVINSKLRKLYYPNPEPSQFYSGNSKSEPFVGLRQNYYAFEWGNALFVVLDPYWYTLTKPAWGWTLGLDQYNWFKNTLANSTAKFKFVFCHQLIGGNGNDARGGTEFAHLFEMGGENSDSTWGFSAQRPNWDAPIHTTMLNNDVSIFFHGHDHFYGKQDKDGIVYQEVPQPSLKSYTTNSAASYGYVNGVILPNRGYLLLSMTDTTAKIEYIRTYLASEENSTRHNGDISHTYTIFKSNLPTDMVDYSPIPGQVKLEQNYPNPFNSESTIQYSLPMDKPVELSIYTILGEKITTLVNENQKPGSYTVHFNAAKYSLPSGLLLCRLKAGEITKLIKMVYVK